MECVDLDEKVTRRFRGVDSLSSVHEVRATVSNTFERK
jgi:hypothetical protein